MLFKMTKVYITVPLLEKQQEYIQCKTLGLISK